MTNFIQRHRRLFLVCALLFWHCRAAGAVNVATHHNDNARLGANTDETVLTTANVNLERFGKLFTRPVDDIIFAQPLYLSGIAVPGKGTHNVVYVGTASDTVYAFDADDPALGEPLWRVNLGPFRRKGFPLSVGPWAYNVGITGTPAIDVTAGTMYVIAGSKDRAGCHYRLHALDVATGAEKLGGPVEINAEYLGARLDPAMTMQRPALLLDHGRLFACFGTWGDAVPSHGWVLSFDAATLKHEHSWCSTPTGGLGGIWMSGAGPSADSDGNVYVLTSNGASDAQTGGSCYSECVVKLSPELTLLDWFMPYNVDSLNATDKEIGASGSFVIPGAKRLVTGSKEGLIYLFDTGALGHFHAGDNSQITQSFEATAGVDGHHIHGTPVWWEGPRGPHVYLWPEWDVAKSFAYRDGRFETSPDSLGPAFLSWGMPGGALSISSRGAEPGTGILWANVAYKANGIWPAPGALYAYDADDLSHELWNSQMYPERDDLGSFARFVPPTVAGGKVYMATHAKQLVVYGLIPRFGPTGTVTVNDTASTITYVGGWAYDARRGLGEVGDDIHRADDDRASLTYAFRGTRVSLIGDRGEDCGRIEIDLDDKPVATVDASGSRRQTHQVLYSHGALGPGTHTLRVVKSGGEHLYFDALIIDDAAPAPPVTPGQLTAVGGDGRVTLTWQAAAGASEYHVKRAVTASGPYSEIATAPETTLVDRTAVNDRTYFYVVSSDNASGESADSPRAVAMASSPIPHAGIAINCGGLAAYPFVADTDFAGGYPQMNNPNGPLEIDDPASMAPEAVYRSERYGPCVYTIPGLSPGGAYRVRLHFTEDFANGPGKRVFDVSIGGAVVLSRFDIFRVARALRKAIVREFDTTASPSGEIVVRFDKVKDNPKIDGIEVIPVGAAGKPPPPR